LPLSRTGGIAALRGLAKQAALTQGFADTRWQDLITATSEAAMNAVVHGGGGQGQVCASADTVQVWIEDQGTGIDVAHLPQATLEKGYSSAGTLGHGMKMMLSTVDRLWLLTSSLGTTVVLEQDRLAPMSHLLALPPDFA
jgi:anti-sigma regulatory factor (Ser/Thr protein kinase)